MDQKPSAPTHASKMFLRRMFLVFLARTKPAQSIANPVCMKKTSIAVIICHIAFAAEGNGNAETRDV